MASDRGRAARWRNLPTGLLMLAPSAVILGTFIIYPLIRAIWLGRQRCNPQGKNCDTTGWGQYTDVWRSEEFQQAIWVTIKFTLIVVPLGVALGIGLAVLADKYLGGIGIFRAIFSSTVATSVAVASLMWFFLLEPSLGVIANVGWINDLFPVVKDPGLLNDPGTALGSVALSSVWAGLGFTFILVTAGLQGIPADLHEAATIDGAGGTRRFWSVTLPLLGPTLLFVVVVLTTRAFQAYGEMDLLTSGGPAPQDSTTTVTYLVYGGSSEVRSDGGLQATTAVWLFVVLVGLALVQLRGLGRRVHYGN
ncbi:MAG: sugar ABC transporter permease [Actinomycetota bacterium]|nr:sugar ABC transporter permease [Actinomycetota bacterium]